MPVSRYFQKWLERDERGRPDSYEHYLGYEASAPLLGLFWHASGYGTSVLYVLRAGLALVLFFVVVFTIVGGKNLVRIEKESSFKTRISETPSLSFGEKAIESGNISSARGLWSNRFLLAVIFSLNTVAKFGFGNVRLRTEDATRLEIYSAWTAWVLGYVWYTLLIYTISAIPALNGLLH